MLTRQNADLLHDSSETNCERENKDQSIIQKNENRGSKKKREKFYPNELFEIKIKESAQVCEEKQIIAVESSAIRTDEKTAHFTARRYTKKLISPENNLEREI